MNKHSLQIVAELCDEESDVVVRVMSANKDPFDFGCDVTIMIRGEEATVDAYSLLRAIKACSGISYDD